MKQIFLNSKKPVGGVCASQDWSQKIPLAKIIFFYKRDILRKHPQIAKKTGSKSEKYKFTNIFSRFFQRGQFSLKGFKQNPMN